jgi:hypothetical protein
MYDAVMGELVDPNYLKYVGAMGLVPKAAKDTTFTL